MLVPVLALILALALVLVLALVLALVLVLVLALALVLVLALALALALELVRLWLQAAVLPRNSTEKCRVCPAAAPTTNRHPSSALRSRLLS